MEGQRKPHQQQIIALLLCQKKTHSFLPEPFLQRLVTLFHPERYAEDYLVPIYRKNSQKNSFASTKKIIDKEFIQIGPGQKVEKSAAMSYVSLKLKLISSVMFPLETKTPQRHRISCSFY